MCTATRHGPLRMSMCLSRNGKLPRRFGRWRPRFLTSISCRILRLPASSIQYLNQSQRLKTAGSIYMVTAATNGHGQKDGLIVPVIGVIFDAEFEEGHLPEIYNALKIDAATKGLDVHLAGEVQQPLGGNRIRAVA